MIIDTADKETLRVLITVKTYPLPSSTYDELVCTAGVTENGDFVRLYPINFRDLPFSQQYKKYQWIEIKAERHGRKDMRKESYRPVSSSLQTIGEPIKPNPGNWKARARYALANKSRSIEELKDRHNIDRTSLGVIRPKAFTELVISPDSPNWKPRQEAAFQQMRLWETRTISRDPPRKVPFAFRYHFECDDTRCRGHKMMIADWELGALFWKLVDEGSSHEESAEKVRQKFLCDLCGDDKDTHLFVGTVHTHPNSWIALGVFYPKKDEQPNLFG